MSTHYYEKLPQPKNVKQIFDIHSRPHLAALPFPAPKSKAKASESRAGSDRWRLKLETQKKEQQAIETRTQQHMVEGSITHRKSPCM